MLKSDLEVCKRKLEEYTSGDKWTLSNSQDIALHVEQEMQQMVERVRLAQTHGDVEAIEAAVQSLRIRYGIGSEERLRTIETLTKRLVEYIVPPCYAHFMWTAKEGTGFFDLGNLTQNGEPSDGFDKPEKLDDSSEVNESNEIAECARRAEPEFMDIFSTRVAMQEWTAALGSKLKLFLTAKQELCTQMAHIGAFANEHILDKVSAQTVGAFLRWSDTVRISLTTCRQDLELRRCTRPYSASIPATWANPLCRLRPTARAIAS
jgi:hypothetical protein